MNKNSLKIVFLGTPQFAATILEALIASPYRPNLVITEPDKPVGRRQTLTLPPVKKLAEQHGLAVAQPATAGELTELLSKAEADLGIVAAYGRILTPPMLAATKRGFLNVHASLLPAHRGATPIQAAILAGDSETGVTIMAMDEGLDTGSIVSWAPLSISESTTTQELTIDLAELGGALLTETLPAYLVGTIQPQLQNPTPDPVSKRLTRESGRLNGTESPTQILRMLRAYAPWPGVWLEVDARRIILLNAHLEAGALQIDRLQLAGKKPVDWVVLERDRPFLAEKIQNFLGKG